MRKFVLLIGLLALVAGFAAAPAQADQDPVAHVICSVAVTPLVISNRIITDGPNNFAIAGACAAGQSCWGCLARLFSEGFEYSDDIQSPTAVSSALFFSLELGDDD